MLRPSLPTIVVGMRESPLETLQLLPAAGSVPWRVPKSCYFGVIVCSVGLHLHNIMTKTHNTTIYAIRMTSAYHTNPFDTANWDPYCSKTFVSDLAHLSSIKQQDQLSVVLAFVHGITISHFFQACVLFVLFCFFPPEQTSFSASSRQSHNTVNYAVH